MTEYVILLSAIVVLCSQIVVQYGGSVKALWEGADGADVWDGVTSGLGGGASDGGGGDGPGCPYYYNPATGRWHDPSTNLFVSFEDAGGHGCS